MQFEGAWTALITPFLEDRGIDWAGFKKNLEFQMSQGISGVLPMGTTGESPSVNWQEHNDLVVEAVKMTEGKCGLLAGSGSNSTDEAMTSTLHAYDHGARAVLLVDCYYNGPSSQELRDEYYAPVAAAKSDVAIVPYIIPGRTGTALTPEDLAILYSKYPNVCAVKEATGDLERMAKTRELCGDNFSIMSGDDDITYSMMTDERIKASGVISVMSNVVPGAVERMVRLILAGNIEEATNLRDALSPIFAIVTVKVKNERRLPNGQTVMVEDRYRNPLAVKTLMNGLGMPAGPTRRPLGMMTKTGVDVVRSAARQIWENNPELFEPIGDFYGVDIGERITSDAYWPCVS